MNLEDEPRQISGQLEFPWMNRREAPTDPWSNESSTAKQRNELSGEARLMERVLAPPNMKAALRRVKRNRGGPGVDGMTVDELLPYLWEHWEKIKSSLLEVRLRVAAKALKRMRDRVREITSRTRGRSMKAAAEELRRYLLGWRGYYGIVHTNRVLLRQDEWIRRRLRAIHLKQWKRGRTVFRELRARGASKRVAAEVAGHTKRWWRTSRGVIHHILNIPYFDQMGIPHLDE